MTLIAYGSSIAFKIWRKFWFSVKSSSLFIDQEGSFLWLAVINLVDNLFCAVFKKYSMSFDWQIQKQIFESVSVNSCELVRFTHCWLFSYFWPFSTAHSQPLQFLKTVTRIQNLPESWDTCSWPHKLVFIDSVDIVKHCCTLIVVLVILL